MRKFKIIIIWVLISGPILGNFLFSYSNHVIESNFYEHLPINQPKSVNAGFSTILFDSVEVFHPPQTEFSIILNFTKDTIYYFELESFTPFSESFAVDQFCISPTGKLYHLYDYQAQINNNQSILFFEYGAAESGNHTITWKVETVSPINLRLYVEEYLSLDVYYDRFTLTPIKDDILYFTDIHRFSSMEKNQEYSLYFQEDTEYRINFFRVNPLSLSDKISQSFENPNIEMSITLGGTTYIYYPNIPTLDYALYNNLESILFNQWPENRHLSNSSFLLRFGSHISGNATLDFTFTDSFPFNLNFAVVVFSPGIIGDGPDAPNQNTTLPDNSSTNDSPFPLPDNSSIFNNSDESTDWLTTWIDLRITNTLNFLRAQFPWIIFGLSVPLCISVGFGIYKNWKEGKEIKRDKKMTNTIEREELKG